MVCVTVAAVAVRLVRGVEFPTAPVKRIVPAPPVKTSVCPPSRVDWKVIFAPFDVKVLEPEPIKLTGFEKTKALAPVTVIFAPT